MGGGEAAGNAWQVESGEKREKERAIRVRRMEKVQSTEEEGERRSERFITAVINVTVHCFQRRRHVGLCDSQCASQTRLLQPRVSSLVR